MELDFYGQLEIRLDDMEMRLKALEVAVTKIPQINMETDPSRPAVVVVDPSSVEPAPLTGL